MTPLPTGTYLFGRYGFDQALAPQLSLQDGEKLVSVQPVGWQITLTFDKTQRYCTGWHDLGSRQDFACPDQAQLPAAYTQCRRCQVKTGFNPAFYHAKTISEQQSTRNQQPHLLYLAHFAPGVVKVGMAWAERGLRRLLEQGARSGVILETFPTADLARHYEAKIAKQPGFVETVQSRAKRQHLRQPYEAAMAQAELLQARAIAVSECGLTADANEPQYFDAYYLGDKQLTKDFVDLGAGMVISGQCIGMIGGLLVCQQDETQFVLPPAALMGYRVRLDNDSQPLAYAPQQASLF